MKLIQLRLVNCKFNNIYILGIILILIKIKDK